MTYNKLSVFEFIVQQVSAIPMQLTYKHICFLSTTLLAGFFARAQNLVPNPGFEDVNICVERRAPCSPSAWQSVAPEYLPFAYMYQPAQGAGYNFIRLEKGQAERSYAQTRLICPLQKGNTYRITLVAAQDALGLPEVDIRFDTNYIYKETPVPFNVSERSLQVNGNDVVKELKKIRAHVKVYQIQKEFVATASYTHILLGSFWNEQAQQPFSQSSGYIYIDSISIVPVKEEPLCPQALKVLDTLYARRHRHTIPVEFFRKRYQGKGISVDAPRKCRTITVKDESIFTAKGRAAYPEASAALDSVVRNYEPGNLVKIRITGYAFLPGSHDYNQVVSTDKARKIADVLVYKNGFSYDDITIDGRGNTILRYDTATAEGREQNNYVEIEICSPIPQTPVAAVAPEPPKPDTLVIPDVLFQFNSSELNAGLYGKLDSLIGKIPRESGIQLQLVGHTDNVGTDTYNLDLSRRRAASVAEYLREKGWEQYIRHVSGAGKTTPVAPNDTPEGRRRNRRVEIIIYKGSD